MAPPDDRLGWRDTFASLRVRNYRLYVLSQIVMNTCGWMQRVAQDWLILELTGNVTLVGITVTLQLGPMLVFGLWGGVVADRFAKRQLLMVTQSLFGLSALMLGVLTLAGVVQPWHILASALFLGVATVVDTPARQAFVPEVAGRTHLRNAISINSSVFQLGALVGPTLAGVGIAVVGEGWSFVLNALACAVAVVLFVAMRRSELWVTPPVPRRRGQLRESLGYVRRTPEIKWAVVLIGFVSVSGCNLVTVLAAYADDVFDIGAGGYGMLNSFLAAGAMTGALASTRRRSLRLRHLVYGAAALGSLQVAAGMVDSLVVFVVLLVAIGVTLLLYLTGSNTIVQTSVEPTMRGRVLALYLLVLFGAQAGAGAITGAIAHAYGAQVAMMACGAGPLSGALVVGVVLARRGRLAPRVILRDRPGRGIVYVVPRPSVRMDNASATVASGPGGVTTDVPVRETAALPAGTTVRAAASGAAGTAAGVTARTGGDVTGVPTVSPGKTGSTAGPVAAGSAQSSRRPRRPRMLPATRRADGCADGGGRVGKVRAPRRRRSRAARHS